MNLFMACRTISVVAFVKVIVHESLMSLLEQYIRAKSYIK